MIAKFENVKILEVANGVKKDKVTPWYKMVVADMEKASRLTLWLDSPGYHLGKQHLNTFVDIEVHDCEQEGFRWKFGDTVNIIPIVVKK